jgi:hypothetical protein
LSERAAGIPNVGRWLWFRMAAARKAEQVKPPAAATVQTY